MQRLAVLLGALVLIAACDDQPKQRPSHEEGERPSTTASPQSLCTKVREVVDAEDKSKDSKKGDAKRKAEMDDCIKELGEVREASPKGFECMTKCTDYKTSGAVLGCFLECQNKDEKLQERAKKQDETKEIDRGKKIVAWTKLPEKSFDGSVTDLDKQVPFTITLVDGFVVKPLGVSLTAFELEDKETFTNAHVSVASWLAEDVEKAAENAKLLKQEAVKKQKTERGYILHLLGDGSLGVDVLTKSGESYVKCSASVYTVHAKEVQAEMLPWLEKLCTSVKLR